MVYNIGNITINVTKDLDTFNKDCALNIMEQINKKPNSVMGFATGSTPVGAYSELVALYKAGKVDFSKIITFNLDEYYPIEKKSPQSYYYFMMEHLFSHVNIDPQKINIPDGSTTDAPAECSEYENKIRTAGGIDYQVLGIGTNGHIGFNEPDVKFPGGTHIVSLKERTIRDNARFFGSVDDVPRSAITMGVKTIMSAKKILFMASGAGKADIVKQALFGDIAPNVPASVLQLHTNVTVVLDAAAAGEILPLLS